MNPLTILSLIFSAIKLALEIRRYLREHPELPSAVVKMLEGTAENLETDATQLQDYTRDIQSP